jgi:hypothetical protein
MPEISDSIKLKRLVAFSCDFMIIILQDKDLISLFLADKDFARVVQRHNATLLGSITEHRKMVISKINSGEVKDRLSDEGLSGDELNFKYEFINELLKKMGLPELDIYKDLSLDENERPDNQMIRYRIMKSLMEKSKEGKFGEWIDILFSGINKILDSIGKAIPGVGAIQEIENFLELTKQIRDSFNVNNGKLRRFFSRFKL